MSTIKSGERDDDASTAIAQSRPAGTKAASSAPGVRNLVASCHGDAQALAQLLLKNPSQRDAIISTAQQLHGNSLTMAAAQMFQELSARLSAPAQGPGSKFGAEEESESESESEPTKPTLLAKRK